MDQIREQSAQNVGSNKINLNFKIKSILSRRNSSRSFPNYQIVKSKTFSSFKIKGIKLSVLKFNLLHSCVTTPKIYSQKFD